VAVTMGILWWISRTGGGEDDDLMSRQTWASKIYTKLRPWGSEKREREAGSDMRARGKSIDSASYWANGEPSTLTNPGFCYCYFG
jgi:hypothetical protein